MKQFIDLNNPKEVSKAISAMKKYFQSNIVLISSTSVDSLSIKHQISKPNYFNLFKTKSQTNIPNLLDFSVKYLAPNLKIGLKNP
jgi:ABC-type uncharacterized transport system ATPase subunit